MAAREMTQCDEFNQHWTSAHMPGYCRYLPAFVVKIEDPPTQLFQVGYFACQDFSGVVPDPRTAWEEALGWQGGQAFQGPDDLPDIAASPDGAIQPTYKQIPREQPALVGFVEAKMVSGVPG